MLSSKAFITLLPIKYLKEYYLNFYDKIIKKLIISSTKLAFQKNSSFKTRFLKVVLDIVCCYSSLKGRA